MLCVPSAHHASFVHVTQVLSEYLSREEYDQIFFTPLLGLAKDPVPNIRFSVARFLSEMSQSGTSACPTPSACTLPATHMSETMFKDDARVTETLQALQLDRSFSLTFFISLFGFEEPIADTIAIETS